MKRAKRTRKSKKINTKFILIIFLMIIFAVLIFGTLSKYVTGMQDTHAQESTAFYFESNIVSEDNQDYIIKNWDCTEEKTINFNVKNYLDKLQITNEDISYMVTAEVVEGNDKLDLEIYENSSIVTGETLTLTGEELSKDDLSLKINLKNAETVTNNEQFKIKLTIKSTEPYVKEIISNIDIFAVNMENYEYELIDSGEYATLYIKVNNPEANITLTCDDQKLILDKSSSLLNGSNVILKNKLQKGYSYEINFIKKNSENTVTISDITIN